MALPQNLENLARLLNPRKGKEEIENAQISIREIWQHILRRTSIKAPLYDITDLCETLKARIREAISKVGSDRRTHAVIKNVLRDISNELERLTCPSKDKDIITKVAAAKDFVNKFVAEVYSKLRCSDPQGACRGVNNRRQCEESCSKALTEIIDEINSMGFLLDTCYDGNRFKNLYNNLKNLIDCQKLSSQEKEALSVLVVALIFLASEGRREVSWLYDLLSSKLELPSMPWIGDVAAAVYAITDLQKNAAETRVVLSPSIIGTLVARLLEC